MALQNTKQNMAQRMMGGIGNMAGQIGQALPVLGGSLGQTIGQGIQNITSPLRGRNGPPKPLAITRPNQSAGQAWSDIQNNMNQKRNQLNQINQLTR